MTVTNWKYKAMLQKVLSVLPSGDKLNYFFQHNALKNLPVSRELFKDKVMDASRHLESFTEYGDKPLDDSMFYEFGAGWDLIQPIAYYFWGVNRQTIIDVRPLVRFELINDVFEKFRDYRDELRESHPWKRSNQNNVRIDYLDHLKRHLGIEYLAPLDARKTELRSNSVDYISSTNTIEHIPGGDILQVMKECYRLLSPGGIMSCRIDYQDHYAFFDNKISIYNFLQYSEKEWNWYNPSLQYQNRLRHKDYIKIIEESGFQVADVFPYDPTAEDIGVIGSLPIDGRFQNGYSNEDLAVRWAFWVLRK